MNVTDIPDLINTIFNPDYLLLSIKLASYFEISTLNR